MLYRVSSFFFLVLVSVTTTTTSDNILYRIWKYFITGNEFLHFVDDGRRPKMKSKAIQAGAATELVPSGIKLMLAEDIHINISFHTFHKIPLF